jgi:hypothetical protein
MERITTVPKVLAVVIRFVYERILAAPSLEVERGDGAGVTFSNHWFWITFRRCCSRVMRCDSSQLPTKLCHCMCRGPIFADKQLHDET